jgi:drug/metabolite transporter (DMT)-like permease
MDFLLATAFNEPGKITFYNVVLFVHVAAALVGFSAAFVYPAFYAFARRANERHLPYFHRVQLWFGPRIITGGATLVLVAGLYLAAEGPYGFSDFFISAGMLIVIAILGLGGAYFAPRERRLLELVQRDVDAAGGSEVTLSADYRLLSEQVERMTWIVAGLVLIAVFLMVTKLGA